MEPTVLCICIVELNLFVFFVHSYSLKNLFLQRYNYISVDLVCIFLLCLLETWEALNQESWTTEELMGLSLELDSIVPNNWIWSARKNDCL